MQNLTQQILSAIEQRDGEHAKSLRLKLEKLGPDYQTESEAFFEKYQRFLTEEGLTLEYGIDCYMKMVKDVLNETLHFFRTGQYSSTSFAEVNEKVYGNQEVMQYYMHGLIVSQFLWSHHFQVFELFTGSLAAFKEKRQFQRYLEIGAGHGLYLSEAINQLGKDKYYEVVDISPTSIDLCKRFVGTEHVVYNLGDVFDYQITDKFDFVTIGEVLEHLEDPQAMLKLMSELLSDDGIGFITVPTNAPAIDHIYLFEDETQIEAMIAEAGLSIVDKHCFHSEEQAEYPHLGIKTPMIYAAFLRKTIEV